MSKTKIEWATHTWNPVTGCTKVSPGCAHCYAERMARRLAGKCGYPEAPHQFDVTLRPDRLIQPLHWRKPRTIFVCSMSDLFHENVSFGFLVDVFTIIRRTRQHTYLILTKRPKQMARFADWYKFADAFPNVWLGVTAENQETADERVPILLQIPAAVRFVSCEPLLGPVDLKAPLDVYKTGLGGWLRRPSYRGAFTHQLRRPKGPQLDWVICGGESGPGARPMHPDWARQVRDNCQEAGVPFFFKQWGGVHKAAAGRLLDGREWNEFPCGKEGRE